MSEPVLELRHLGKTFGNGVAVDDLSLEIRSGECLGLIGPNGAGKTTTLRICLGALSADAGEVLAFGKSVSQHLREIKQRIGVVSQFDSLDPDFTCAENLAVYGRYFGLSRSVIQARIPSLLDFAALQTKAGAKPSELSGA